MLFFFSRFFPSFSTTTYVPFLINSPSCRFSSLNFDFDFSYIFFFFYLQLSPLQCFPPILSLPHLSYFSSLFLSPSGIFLFHIFLLFSISCTFLFFCHFPFPIFSYYFFFHSLSPFFNYLATYFFVHIHLDLPSLLPCLI